MKTRAALRRLLIEVGVGVALPLALGCGSASQAPSATGADATMPLLEVSQRLTEAERIESNVELLGLPMGTMVLDVCPADSLITTTIEASSLVRLVRRLSGTATTHLSSDGHTPERTEVEVHDGDDTRTYRVAYVEHGYEYEYERTKRETKRGKRDMDVDAPLYDLQSAMALLRTWQPRLDEEAYFYVVLGRQLWRAQARSVGPEMLTVSGGPRLTRRVDGVAVRVETPEELEEPNDARDVRRAFSLWFENDRAGYPVRLVAKSSYGDVSMSLSRYTRTDEFCPSQKKSSAP